MFRENSGVSGDFSYRNSVKQVGATASGVDAILLLILAQIDEVIE
jgi:hypothetical protein